ncbi:tetratricopeptide repeat protein [Actinomadura terrae]|uniref:tetratricopeptide repeat protein n=1 Tax=Actinomadura terrae TaxID=604353 RepID=UPI001FA732BB|nr:tetratricopeptide repeat protein [Actinomadura terrae]
MRTGARIVGTPVSYGLETFKDRSEEQTRALELLADQSLRIVTISGRRGIGKSALAAKIAERLCSGGCSIVNLSARSQGAISTERVFFSCLDLATPEAADELRALWASQRAVDDKIHLLFAALASERYILLLDNLEDQLTDEGWPKEADLDLLLDAVLRVRQGPKLLITTQVPVLLDPATRRFQARVHLTDGLPVAESVELLRELDRDGEAGVSDAPLVELEKTAKRLHGVPRALELLVGAMASDHLTLPTLAEMLTDYASRGDMVDQLAQDRYRRLDELTRLTLNVLAVFSGPVSAEAVAWAIHPLAPRLDVQSALSRLVQIHMLSVDRRRRIYALHPMDADIAYRTLAIEGPLGQQVLERRAAGWYSRQHKQPPWRSVVDVDSYRREFEHRLRAGDYGDAAFTLDQVSEFLVWQGSHREVIAMHLALRNKPIGDIAKLAHLVGYGQARHIGGPLEDAIPALREAIEIAERIGDNRQLWRALLSLGDCYRGLRQLDEASLILARAVDVGREVDEPRAEAHALLVLSLTWSYRGDPVEALQVCDRLRELASRTADPRIRGWLSDATSAACIVARRWEDAIQAACQAVEGYNADNYPEAVGYARNTEGIALIALGRNDDAVEVLDRGRNDGAEFGFPRAEGLCLFNLAWTYWISGRYRDAQQAADQAVAAFRRSGGTDVAASEMLRCAIDEVLAGNMADAAIALRDTVSLTQGNSDFVPGEWLLTEADRLDQA